MGPFRNLLKNKTTWNWTPEHSVAFKHLKQNFLNAVTIQYNIPGAKLKVQTDASDIGVGAILYKVDNNGNHRILAIVSRFLS